MSNQKNNSCLFNLENELRAVWEITNRCNYKCVHCCSDSNEDNNLELNTEEIKKVLDDLVAEGLDSIYYTGGEPLIREDFFDIIRYASSLINPKKINIASNGRIINLDIAKELSKLNIGTILISLDGYDKKTAQEFRGIEDSYEHAINAIDYLTSAGVKVRMGVVIWKSNYKNLENFIKIGLEKGANNIFFNWLIPIGRAKKHPEIQLDPSLYFSIANQLEELKEKYEGKIEIGYHRFSKITKDDKGCEAGSKIFHIKYDGRISPCSWVYKVDSSFLSESSIKDTRLSDILNEEAFRRLKNILKVRDNKNCGPCCPAMCKIYTGNYFNPDPLYESGGMWIKDNEKE